MTHATETLILGLLTGGVYALLASGLTLIFGVMNIINVAHGALLVLAGLLTFELWRRLGLDPIASAVVTTPVMFAVGWAIYRLFVARIRTAPVSMTVLLTFALAITLEGAMGLTWKNVFRSVTPGYVNQSFHLGPFFFPKAQVFGCLAAVAVLSGLWLLLTRTWAGRAIRAASQNPQGSALVGVDVAWPPSPSPSGWPRRAPAAPSCRCSTRCSPPRTTCGSRGCSASWSSAAWAASRERSSGR